MVNDTDVPEDPWEHIDRLQRELNELADRLVSEREKRLEGDHKNIRLLDELDAMHRDNQALRAQILEMRGPHG
jgi:hypothetical protein